MNQYQDKELTHSIIAAAIEVHKALGPGLLEAAYKTCLMMAFDEKGLRYRQEMSAPIVFKTRRIDGGFRVDFLVEDRIVVELKAIEKIHPLHKAQLLTYLRLLNKQVGLLINFNVSVLKNGISRCVLDVPDKVALEML
jgi:GxxExxY protein